MQLYPAYAIGATQGQFVSSCVNLGFREVEFLPELRPVVLAWESHPAPERPNAALIHLACSCAFSAGKLKCSTPLRRQRQTKPESSSGILRGVGRTPSTSPTGTLHARAKGHPVLVLALTNSLSVAACTRMHTRTQSRAPLRTSILELCQVEVIHVSANDPPYHPSVPWQSSVSRGLQDFMWPFCLELALRLPMTGTPRALQDMRPDPI